MHDIDIVTYRCRKCGLDAMDCRKGIVTARSERLTWGEVFTALPELRRV